MAQHPAPDRAPDARESEPPAATEPSTTPPPGGRLIIITESVARPAAAQPRP